MRTIDVFVKIIDNYGDIGFVLEIIDAWKRRFSTDTFHIYTNNPSLFVSFLKRMDQTGIKVEDENGFNHSLFSGIGWFFFKYPIPFSLLNQKEKVYGKGIYFDYLSFHPDSVIMQGKEHIQSTPYFSIHTIINTPLSNGGGTLFPISARITKNEWCTSLGLDISLSERPWITVFCYAETWKFLKNQIPSDMLVWYFEERDAIEQIGNVIYLPFQSFENYQKLLQISDVNIVRGEVSLVRAIHTGKSFLWDMYKGIGGWNQEEFHYFIEWMNTEYVAGDNYEVMSRNLNTRDGEISFVSLIEGWKAPSKKMGNDIIETICTYMQ